MEEKAQATKKGKKIAHQKTLNSKKIRVSVKREKIKCNFCNSKVLDLARHLLKCYRNPDNSPTIEIDWSITDDFNDFK